MNEEIIGFVVKELEITKKQVEAVLSLLQQGNTVPFIARYRKEATGGLNEDQIRDIDKYYQYQVNLLKRKEDVIRLIDEKGMLTDQLKKDILQATKLNTVEDLYRPYKEKRKTKATEAKAKGLEPLSKWILNQINSFTRNSAKLTQDDSALMQELFVTMQALREAANSISYLAKLLENQPDALIFGKAK